MSKWKLYLQWSHQIQYSDSLEPDFLFDCIFSWMMEKKKHTQLSEDFMADQLWGLSILFQWQENVIEL